MYWCIRNNHAWKWNPLMSFERDRTKEREREGEIISCIRVHEAYLVSNKSGDQIIITF